MKTIFFITSAASAASLAAAAVPCTTRFVNPVGFAASSPFAVIDSTGSNMKLAVSHPPLSGGEKVSLVESDSTGSASTPYCYLYDRAALPAGVSVVSTTVADANGCLYDTYTIPLSSYISPPTVNSMGCGNVVTSSGTTKNFLGHFNIYSVTSQSAQLGGNTGSASFLQSDNPMEISLSVPTSVSLSARANILAQADTPIDTSVTPTLLATFNRADIVSKTNGAGKVRLSATFKLSDSYKNLAFDTNVVGLPAAFGTPGFTTIVTNNNGLQFGATWTGNVDLSLSNICAGTNPITDAFGTYTLRFTACNAPGNSACNSGSRPAVPFSIVFNLDHSSICSDFVVAPGSSSAIFLQVENTDGTVAQSPYKAGGSYQLHGKISGLFQTKPFIISADMIASDIPTVWDLVSGNIRSNAGINFLFGSPAVAIPSSFNTVWDWYMPFTISVGTSGNDNFFSTSEISGSSSAIVRQFSIGMTFGLSYANSGFARRALGSVLTMNDNATVVTNFTVAGEKAAKNGSGRLNGGARMSVVALFTLLLGVMFVL